jgi:hypothetical protein
LRSTSKHQRCMHLSHFVNQRDRRLTKKTTIKTMIRRPKEPGQLTNLLRSNTPPPNILTVQEYIGDIRSPYSGPGDFSAWYQVFLDGKWVSLDARHNYPRIGRILMATGRDATDVAITTSFGLAQLTYFLVESNEIDSQGNLVPLPRAPDRRPNRPEVNTPTQTNSSQPSPSQTQSATS